MDLCVPFVVALLALAVLAYFYRDDIKAALSGLTGSVKAAETAVSKTTMPDSDIESKG